MNLTYTIGGVTITGSTHFVDQDSVTLPDQIGMRNTLSFRVISKDGSYRPAEGAAVSVSDGTNTRFGGNIRQLSVTQKGTALWSEIGCASWESLFDRRPTGVRSYTNQTAGYIFEDLLTNCMGSEGLSASVVTAGPTIPSFECDFASVREAYDTLCALASNDTDTYMWDCTSSLVARFYRSDSFHAPFDITSTSTDVLYVGGGARIGAAWSLDKYTNRVFVRMGKLIRAAETQSFTVGTTTTFTLDYPVALVPTITLDAAAQTVGILDVDTGQDWYWQEGSPNITRGTGTGGTTLDVLYQGYDSIVLGPFENAAEVAARAAAEGNLGYYVTVLDSGDPGTAADAATRAQAWLDKYSQIPCTVTYPTQRDDLRAGQWQDIYWPEIGVDVRCLLESVTMTQTNGYYLWTAKAISGALTGDYKMRLRELRGASGNTGGTPGAPGAPGTTGAPGPAGSGVPAPNVTSATAEVAPGMWANDSSFSFRSPSGSPIVLPTGDPDYAHLAAIQVEARIVGTTGWLPIVKIPSASFGGSTVAWAGDVSQFPQSGTVAYWECRFVVENEIGSTTEPTASPVAVTVGPSAVTNITGAAEIGTRYVIPSDNNRLPWLTAACVPVLAGGQVPQSITYLLSDDNGTSWTHIDATRISSVGQQLKVARLVPGAAQTWMWAICTGFLGSGPVGANGKIADADLATYYPGIFRSTGFSVAAIATPAASNGITATVGAFAYKQDGPEGSTYGYIPPFTGTDPTSGADAASIFYFRICITDVDASHNPISARKPHDGWQVTGPGVSHTTAQPLLITLNGQAGIRYEVFIANKTSSGAGDFANTATNTLNNVAWNGGSPADHLDVMFGALPAGAMDMTRTKPSTWGAGVYLDSAGRPKVGTAGDPLNMFANARFDDGIAGWGSAGGTWSVAASGGLTVNSAILAGGTGANFITQMFGTKPGKRYYISSLYRTTVLGYNLEFKVWWLDKTQGYLSQDYVDSAVVGGWQQPMSFTTVAASANAAYVLVFLGATGIPAGEHFEVDSPRLIEQTPTGPGTQATADGGVQAYLATPLTTLSGAITIASAAISNVYMAAGSVTAANSALAAGSVTAANAALAANSVVDSNVVGVNIGKLVAGAVTFSGTVSLSRGSGYPVITMDTSGVYLFGVASGTTGLTTSPFVVVTSAGIGLYQGGTSSVYPSLMMTATGLGLYSYAGNTAYPYMILSSSGLAIVSGSFRNETTASQVKLSYASGASLTLNSGGVKILNGSYSMVLSASDLYLYSVDGSTASPYVRITSGGVTIVGGTLTSPTISGGSLTIITSNGTFAVSGTSNGVVMSLSSWGANMSPGFMGVTGPGAVGPVNISDASGLVLGPTFGVQAYLTPTSFHIGGLPSSNPGAGSLWYDPADARRVKYGS